MQTAGRQHLDTVETAWGARLIAPDRTRFRIWAPGVETLTIRIDNVDADMTRDEHGWFEHVADVGAGTPYAYLLPDGTAVADPASRQQQGDVHGSSLVVDPHGFEWRNAGWRGRPWEEAVLYEIHIGTFTPEGTFAAAEARLPHLAELGITFIELMPVAHFAGTRGWGYDGVLLYAPHSAYGTPDELRSFVDAAHGLGIMVKLDVVYNHFGPDGNYLPVLAPDFFHPERQTPWGAAIAYEKRPVRQFFIENALYWLNEFRLDGLRFDAVDHVRDADSESEILIEIAEAIRGAIPDREIHLATEDNRNVVHLHPYEDGKPKLFTVEWNDDFHNAAHVVASGEVESYYEDFADRPVKHVQRLLAEGFAYQGESSKHGGGEGRGVPSAGQPPVAFLDFLQNHDQVGNRAQGERLLTLSDRATMRALTAVLLLSPHIPLIFMGEEWGETRPFLFFTDFEGELAKAVREGRRKEFSKFAAYDTSEERKKIPDPNEADTFLASKIDWEAAATPDGVDWLSFYRRLLALRQEHIVPLLRQPVGNAGRALDCGERAMAVDWNLAGKRLSLRANFAAEDLEMPKADGAILFAEPATASSALELGRLPPSSVVFTLGPQ